MKFFLTWIIAIAAMIGMFAVIILLAEYQRDQSFDSEPLIALTVCLAICVIGFVLWRWQARSHARCVADETAEATEHGMFIARKRTGGMLVFIVLACGLMLGGLVLKWREDPSLGWGLLVVGIPLLGLPIWQVFRLASTGNPVLRMDAQGLHHATYGWVPWNAVIGMELHEREFRGYTHFHLLLGVRDTAHWLARAAWSTRLLRRRVLREKPAYGFLDLHLNHLDRTPEAIYASARALRATCEAPFLNLWTHLWDAPTIESRLKVGSTAAQLALLHPAPTSASSPSPS